MTGPSPHKIQAFGISIGMYAAFLAILFFFKIMYEPKEDPIALGVDLNYGVDLVGYGNLQTTNKASKSKNNYDVKPADKQTAKKPATQPTKTQPTPTPQRTPQKTSPSKTSKVITSNAEDSPVTAKKSNNTTSQSKPSPPAPVSKPTPAPPKREVDAGSLFQKGNSSGSNGTIGTRDGEGGNNNGDGKPGDVGDQGDPRGTLDGKSLYGNPGKGGGSGASVSISGWKKKNLQVPKDKSAETGRIIFKVVIDDRGDVKSLIPTSTTVSPSVTKFYSDYLKRNLSKYLTPTGNPPPKSSGTIVINITSGS